MAVDKRALLCQLRALSGLGAKIELRHSTINCVGDAELTVAIKTKRQEEPIVGRFLIAPRGHKDADLLGFLTSAARGTP